MKNEFWSKSPQERTRIVAERLRKRMDVYHVTEEQVAKCTRMDADKLHRVLAGEVVMNVSDYVDIYYAIPNADESHISSDQLRHHHLLLKLSKLAYLEDGWNGEGSKAVPERLVRRFRHHIRYVNDSDLSQWELSATNDGNLLMQRGDDSLLISWEEIKYTTKGLTSSVIFTIENIAGIMEQCSLQSR